MKTTRSALVVVLGVAALFLGGCGGAHLTNTLGGGGGSFGGTIHADRRDDHATLDWNAATQPLALPSRLAK